MVKTEIMISLIAANPAKNKEDHIVNSKSLWAFLKRNTRINRHSPVRRISLRSSQIWVFRSNHLIAYGSWSGVPLLYHSSWKLSLKVSLKMPLSALEAPGPLSRPIWPITYGMAGNLTIVKNYFARFDIPLNMALLSAPAGMVIDNVLLLNTKRVSTIAGQIFFKRSTRQTSHRGHIIDSSISSWNQESDV